ncbi:MAG: hypothetical protein ABL963_04130 [Longimicrobiales bacterium]
MKKLLSAVALAGMLAVPGAAQAQSMAGPFLAYTDDAEAFGVGGFIAIPLPALHPNISLVPDFIWFFPDAGNLFEVNGDLMYTFPVSADSPVAPFAFGGLNIARFSVDIAGTNFSDTNVGINLGGGVNFSAGSVNPFAGAKVELEGGESFVIFGGLSFPIGGGA